MPRRRAETPPQAPPTPRRRREPRRPPLPLNRRLVLNQWLLGLFGVERFQDLAEHLRDESLEGLDENNVHRLHHALVAHFPDLPDVPVAALREYDENIVRHTLRLNERRIIRGEPRLVWKYFQYLTLLFTEIYLDRYFRDPRALLKALNARITAFNDGKDEGDRVQSFDEMAEAWSQLNKVAFWSATGSGKTLLLHANILQYQHYLESHGRNRELNRILLLTPNEGLSEQHRLEFEAAGISAEIFDKDQRQGDLFRGGGVQIIDIHKLRDEGGDKTVATEAFEGNNLVLVDEGHRGTASGEDGKWMERRNALCEKGFSFEYSATFGQAVKGNDALVNLYAKSILFDYSYGYFYGDGFGKDYHILNLDDETQKSYLEPYLVACLLAFFQQQRLYRENERSFRRFNLEKPLWIFVGSSVTKSSTQERSDVVKILLFLAQYLGDRHASVKHIKQVLSDGLVGRNRQNVFEGRFEHLNTSGLLPEQVYEETLALLFNAQNGGALHVENLKGATGEIALRVGDSEPFGVINVGDDAKLVKLCEDHPELLKVNGDSTFQGSLFQGINSPNSMVNVLIGSKKFTEGWNSWRVSTMGLMNIGTGEGPQIIQLFGRGVRLKGYEWSLKRSSSKRALPEGVTRPKQIGMAETLNIFGIRADYMAQFKSILEEEGLPPDNDPTEFFLPVIQNLGKQKLKTIRLKKVINGVSTEFGDAFRKLGPVPTLQRPNPDIDPSTVYLHKNQVVVNWYPKILGMKSGGVLGGDGESTFNQTQLTPRHVAFLDFDRLFFDLERFKAEKAWHNFNLTRDGIEAALLDSSWYRLLIPEAQMAFDSFERVRVWQDVALALLKGYAERYYTFRKRDWEMPHLEYQEMTDTDPNLLPVREGYDEGGYRLLIDQSREDIVQRLTELKEAIVAGKLKDVDFAGLKTLWFGAHLYQPLLHVEGGLVEVIPAPLNKGEKRFVQDLKRFHDSAGGFFDGKEFYLLRNLSRGRGVGFFEAGNFHPDFILWLLVGGRQHVAFVDPKGILHLGATDPKIQFYETIREIEVRLGDPKVSLSSFIVSITPSTKMKQLWGLTKAQMEDRNIFFQEEERDTYVRSLLEAMLRARRPRSEEGAGHHA